MLLPRLSGILLHPTSLPGPHGSGDIGASATHFIDWLVLARQSLWQVLPLCDIGIGNSPYMSPSAFAGNVLLIDLVQLRDVGWLDDADLATEYGFDARHVNFPAMIPFRTARLRKAAARFFEMANTEACAEYAAFCREERSWLDDYALFMALESAHGDDTPWQDWPQPLAMREPQALRDAAAIHANDIAFWKFCQWQFFAQWARLKSYANARGVEIVGDMPIFVALQSADVWAHRELFDLDADGRPQGVAGVPPDKFSDAGQHWGNPLYRWPTHAANGYRWWIERMRRMHELFDVVRIDHFRGFESYWEIPANAASPVEGRWRAGPKAAVFDAMHSEFGKLRMIAEDLGFITAEVNLLRKQQRFPGMRILQFAFDFDPGNPYLPHNYHSDTVVYTGTHDNDTTRGWWAALSEHERDYARRYLSVSGDWIHWDLIRVASASVAAFSIFPLQDVLGLDSSHRMNRPGEIDGSWGWRFQWNQVEHWYAERLAELTQLYGRIRGTGMRELPHEESSATNA